MGTNSLIACQMQDGTFKAVYCHSDGMLSYNGVYLNRFHNTQKAARKIISLNACSVLDARLEPKKGEHHGFDYRERAAFCSVFYRRDRGDRVAVQSFETLDELLSESESYGLTYVWLEQGGWHFHGYADEEEELPDGSTPFRPLTQALALCQKSQARIAHLDEAGMTVEWRDAGCPHRREETSYGAEFIPMPIGWQSESEQRETRYVEQALF